MNTERWQQVKRVLDDVIQVESGQRSSFLSRACAGDPELQREVESLLASHEQAGTNFLKDPAADLQSLSSLPAASREGRRIGVYQIISEIGRGGMGEVYRAVRADGQYTKEVAVKLVRAGQDSRFIVERFINERQILASLDHPNIARLLDGGTTADGVPYLVMELIEGQPIDSYCDRERLSISARLQLFRQVCAAVHYAHQRLVIHRDIKPSNILVTREGVPKLLDFGIAKLVSPVGDAQTTLTQAMTPEYASPEQIRGEPITTATDVYSLGVVLYQLLTGRSPYPGDTRSPHKLALAVCETQPARPSTVVIRPDPTISPAVDPQTISSAREGSPARLQRRLAGDLDDILLMALRKETTRRYGSVEQFAEDLRKHLEGLPVAASKGSWSYRAEKFVQRHKMAIAAASIVVLAVAGGVGATIREARIAQANARRAEKRFNDVRSLANSLIFDVDKSIADLPGATSARKMLVNDALQYLDTLAKEAKGDFALQRELAGAYNKLGAIQGNPFTPNLGETAAALESLRKALAIRETLAKANPANRDDQLALAFSHEQLGSILLVTSGSPQEALLEVKQALAILEPLSRDNPNDLAVLGKLEGVYESLGDIEGGNGASANFGDDDAALENHRKFLATAERILRDRPGDKAVLYGRIVAYLKVAQDLVRKGDRAAALEFYEKARIALTSPDYTANKSPGRMLGLVYQNVGNVLMMNGDYPAARESYRQLMEISDRLFKEDPKNATARTDAAYDRAFLGLATVRTGEMAHGLELLQSAIDLLQKEADQDPNKSVLRRYLVVSSIFRGEVLLRSGNVDGALADFRKSAAILEAFASGNTGDIDAQIHLAAANGKIADALTARGEAASAIAIHQKSLAVLEPLAHSAHPVLQAQYAAADNYSGLGEALLKGSMPAGSSRTRQVDTVKQACSWFEQSLAEWQRVPNPGKFSPTGFETFGPSGVSQELAACRSRLEKLAPR